MLIQNINLVKQIPDKKLRNIIRDKFWGLIPKDGRQRHISQIDKSRTLRIDPSKR